MRVESRSVMASAINLHTFYSFEEAKGKASYILTQESAQIFRQLDFTANESVESYEQNLRSIATNIALQVVGPTGQASGWYQPLYSHTLGDLSQKATHRYAASFSRAEAHIVTFATVIFPKLAEANRSGQWLTAVEEFTKSLTIHTVPLHQLKRTYESQAVYNYVWSKLANDPRAKELSAEDQLAVKFKAVSLAK